MTLAELHFGIGTLPAGQGFAVQFYDNQADPLDEYFGLKTQLEEVLSRPVGLLMSGSVRNPYVLAGIEASKEPVYAA